MTRSADRTALDLAQHLRLTVNRLRRVVRSATIAEAGSRAQEAALSWLARKGPLTTAELARWEQVRPQSMGATVADLVRAGLATKAPDPHDGRRELVTLTDAGHDHLHQIADLRDHQLAVMLSRQLTHADRQALKRTLTLLDSLTDDPPVPPTPES